VPEDDDAWLREQLSKLTPGRLRHLLHLGAVWDGFCQHLQHRLTKHAAGQGSKDGKDDADQWLQQWQAIYWRALYLKMNAPVAAVAATTRLLEAFEHRRAGIHDTLFELEPGGATRPTIEKLYFRSYAVHTAVQWQGSEAVNRRRSLGSAFKHVAGLTAWIARDKAICTQVGGAPTAGAIRGWHEDADKDVRFGRFHRAIAEEFPEGMGGETLVKWLITQLSSPAGKAFAANNKH
jgi:hypothetical protein